VNIIDIARIAGVSVATVSRVLNDSGRVRPETRDKVLQVVEKHRYTPNALARGLIQSKTAMVGILTVDILNPYYAAVTHHAEQRLRELGYTALLCNTGESSHAKRAYIHTLLENRVDGLIFVGSTFRSDHSDHLLDYAADALPTVLINSYTPHANTSCVVCDDSHGIQLAVDHILDRTRSMLFVGTIRTASGRRKLNSFRTLVNSRSSKALRNHRVILTSDHTLERLPDRLSHMYERTPFDGVIASDDLFAHAVLKWSLEARLGVPGNIRIVGYNDSHISTYAIPSLTTVNSRMDMLGITAADRLKERIDGNVQENETIVLEPFLHERDST
jgi:LacI family transcriptional regulator